MSACITSIDASNHKMLHATIKTILCALDANVSIPASEVTVALCGGALQTHLPHCMTLLGPELSWELWRDDAHTELCEMHLSKKVKKCTGTVDAMFAAIASRAGQRFICLVDLDVHLPARVLRTRNEKGIKPTVDSENKHYSNITERYAQICRRALELPHVMVLSIPFRAPWHTEDFERNKEHALWVHKDDMMRYPKLEKFKQYNTRPRSTEVRGLCWPAVAHAPEDWLDFKRIDVEMREYNANRRFLDHDILEDLITHYNRTTQERQDLFAHETSASAQWRHNFMRNSMAWCDENAAHEHRAFAVRKKNVRSFSQ